MENINQKEYTPFQNIENIKENWDAPFIYDIYYDKNWNKIIESKLTFFTGSHRADAQEKTEYNIKFLIDPITIFLKILLEIAISMKI